MQVREGRRRRAEVRRREGGCYDGRLHSDAAKGRRLRWRLCLRLRLLLLGARVGV